MTSVQSLQNRLCLYLLLLLPMGWLAATPVPTKQPVVQAVLFYSPTCPACHYVISTVLPPITEEFGDQLLVAGVDISTIGGQELYLSAIEYFEIPPERQAVPLLIIGDQVLLGTVEIPELLPGLIEDYLEQGGVSWPSFPGLAEVISSSQEQETATAAAPGSVAPSPQASLTPPVFETPYPPASLQPGLNQIPGASGSTGISDRLAMDPVGNALAIVVLIGLLASIAAVLSFFLSPKPAKVSASLSPLIPLLCLVGSVAAGYLTYVEMTQIPAVCGPVGDCNTVQHSQYARLFGFIPLGLLGLGGYVAITAAWMVARFGKGQTASIAALELFGMTLAGTLFSAYLTFLEPFVIGATCAWCITSAVIMAVLMVLSAAPGKKALTALRRVPLQPVSTL